MTGIFIIARLGSTRLKQKHLITVKGRSFIEWLAGRFQAEFAEEIGKGEVKLIIATSTREENRQFLEVFKGTGVEVFFGNDENIPARLLECAEDKKVDIVISIDGDDILCSPGAARLVIDEMKKGSQMVYSSGLPLGMNVSGFATGFLKQSVEKQNSLKLETGWGKIFDPAYLHTINLPGFDDAKEVRMTLDYDVDAEFFSKVIDHFGDAILTVSDKDLVTSVMAEKFYEINEGVSKEYWENFNKQKQSEK